MAQIINNNTEDQLSAMMGKSLGSGISQLIQNKIQKMQTAQGLQALGIPGDKANQLSQLPQALLNPILRNYTQQNKPEINKLTVPNKINTLLKLRKRLYSKNLSNPEYNAEYLSKSRLSDIEKKLVTATDLDNELVDYFLSMSRNNEKKAKVLAKRFGFKF